MPHRGYLLASELTLLFVSLSGLKLAKWMMKVSERLHPLQSTEAQFTTIVLFVVIRDSDPATKGLMGHRGPSREVARGYTRLRIHGGIYLSA